MSRRFSFGNMDETPIYDDIIMRKSDKKEKTVNNAIIVPLKKRPIWKRYFLDCFQKKKY